MLGLELVVVLGVAVLLCGLLARRVPVAPALLLVAVGVVVGFVPELRRAELPPEVTLLLFLPPLLYWESITTSLREIRNNLRSIVLASTGLVVATAAVVAVAAHELGMGWGPAWTLGAVVAPTDATAVGTLARALPRRMVITLRAESLINDGTALVIYGLAVSVTVHGTRIGAGHVSWLVVEAYGGGLLAGILVGAASWWVRRFVDDPMLDNIAIVITPFGAFLLAQPFHASGVLAVVVCGLIMSQLSQRITEAAGRQQTTGFWSTATTLLASALFVLIGIQAQSAVRGLTSVSAGRAVAYVAAGTGAMIGIRWAWMYLPPLVVRIIRPGDGAPSLRQPMVSSSAGFRGAVSLAAALAVPTHLHSGAPFPDRDLIVLVTSAVILLSLLQALPLPAIVRFARLPEDTTTADEAHFAEVAINEAAIDSVDRIAADLGTAPEVLATVRRELDKRRRLLEAPGDSSDPIVQYHDQYTDLWLAVIASKRLRLLELRDSRQIDDIVLRQVLAQVDIEEVRLSGRPPPE